MELPKRKTNRLPDYDYSTPGAYFITICAKEKRCIFSTIVGGGAFDAPQIRLSKIGETVKKYVLSGNNVSGICVDKFVIMPNHIHLILLLEEHIGPSRAPAPTQTARTNEAIPHFISTLKRFCNREEGENLFQRSYHDHVIRNEQDYLRIWNYIDTNPARWEEDCFYCE